MAYSAITAQASLGLLGDSPFFQRVQGTGLGVVTKLPPPARYAKHRIGNRVHRVALPVTLTPFASVKPCSARCVFCSETLVPKQSTGLSASLRPRAGYFDGLREVLYALRGLPFSISLSGLEATDDPPWLARVLALFTEHESAGNPVGEKVLYTNGNGLARQTSGSFLLPLLAAFGLTRAEFSRHSPKQERNDRIMRFRPSQPIGDTKVFERTVADAVSQLPVRLVCVLQQGGVGNLAEVSAYLKWARKLGVRDVVFREFSRLGDLYRPNRSYRHIETHRVVLENLLDELWPTGSGPSHEFEPLGFTAGYYYWNLRCRWNGIAVTFETSDYLEMKRRHGTGIVHKLIYHANGNLCGDWDPGKEVLLRTTA